MYLVVAAIFIPLGVLVFVQSSNLYASPLIRYDNEPLCNVGYQTLNGETRSCRIRLVVDKNVSAPAYLYYGMVNFYQNARTYVSSRSDEQLRGDADPDTSTCDPLETFPNGSTIVPCGLVANSRFNDTFELFRDDALLSPLTLNGSGIAWSVDRDTRFLGAPNNTAAQNASIENEDFMVWMRLAAYRNWKKLYRVIDDGLEEGNYTVRINASFPVESFDGEKFFFVSETTWFGGPNEALGITYIAVGGVALVLAIAITVRSRASVELDMPEETTVFLDGLVKDPFVPGSAPVDPLPPRSV